MISLLSHLLVASLILNTAFAETRPAQYDLSLALNKKIEVFTKAHDAKDFVFKTLSDYNRKDEASEILKAWGEDKSIYTVQQKENIIYITTTRSKSLLRVEVMNLAKGLLTLNGKSFTLDSSQALLPQIYKAQALLNGEALSAAENIFYSKADAIIALIVFGAIAVAATLIYSIQKYAEEEEKTRIASQFCGLGQIVSKIDNLFSALISSCKANDQNASTQCKAWLNDFRDNRKRVSKQAEEKSCHVIWSPNCFQNLCTVASIVENKDSSNGKTSGDR